MTMMWKNNQGFTLIEVIIAMAIFTLSFLVLIDSQNITIRNNAKTRRITLATLLAQNKMAEFILKYQGKSLGEIPEQEDGQFEGEYATYRWEESSRGFNYDLSFLLELAQGGQEQSEEQQASPLAAYLPKISDFIRKSTKEITLTVYWKEGSTEQKVSITTHLFDYKAPVTL